jgi:hypothetical protein
MNCVACGSAAVTKQPEYAAQDYRWFCCRDCDPQFRRAQCWAAEPHPIFPSDVIALVVLWRLHYRPALRDLIGVFLQLGRLFSHEAVCDWGRRREPCISCAGRSRWRW